ncbi:protein gar2-like [Chenopodium quinoa]|uniref:protein gar2-like n=1 Tax=Chenopodium quinoa TaxID=63459 RepID=UPI000B76E133|nr:protein gar2-like [Chenopodium quinoa]
MVDGLRKVNDDDSVREMIDMALKYRGVEVYAVHGDNDPMPFLSELQLTPSKQPKTVRPKKLPIKRGPPVRSSPRKKSQTLTICEPSQKALDSSLKAKKDAPTAFVPTPPTNTLSNQNYSSESEKDDPIYKPEVDKGKGGGEAADGEEVEGLEDLEAELDKEREEILDDELQYQSESEDEEYTLARKRARDITSNLIDIAKQIQKEAAKCLNKEEEEEERAAGDRAKVGEGTSTEVCEGSSPHSDYEQSDEEFHTPPDSDEEDLLLEGKGSQGY